MKSLFAAATFVLAGAFVAAPVSAETVSYPNAENASFSIDYPDDWTMEPGESEGDYVTLSAPTGANLQLRTIPGTEDSMGEAMDENAKYLGETFTNVKLDEPKKTEEGGLTGLLVLGTGTDADKQDTGFAMYYLALPDGHIAEIWYSVIKGDTEGADGAVKIMNSFRTP